MEPGMIGLGRMGTNMVRRLRQAGHQCVVHDLDPKAVDVLTKEEAIGSQSIEELALKLQKPRVIWMMVPAATVDLALASLVPFLEADDVVIDGSNSHYRDDLRRAAELKPKGIHHVDVGTSGGIWGSERGSCLMIGGEEAAVRRLDPAFAALAPGIEAAPRTRGLESVADSAEHAYLHCGPSGAGHFVKMVHNDLEYGIMASHAEGLNILRHANLAKKLRAVDAETAPLRDPENYPYDLSLENSSSRVSESGEDRWTIAAAIDESVPAPVLSAALDQRFSFGDEYNLANKVLSALRYQFCGHEENSGAKNGSTA